jgi:hypothetical protein
MRRHCLILLKNRYACHKRDVTQLEVAGAFAPFPGPMISKTVPSGQ